MAVIGHKYGRECVVLWVDNPSVPRPTAPGKIKRCRDCPNFAANHPEIKGFKDILQLTNVFRTYSLNETRS